MRRFLLIIGFIATVLALILAVTPLSKLAYIPALIALVIGGTAYYLSVKKNLSKKSVYLIFLLTGIALFLTTYKAIFNTSEVADLEELELKEESSIEDSKEILESLDLEGIDDFELEIDEEAPNLMETEDFPDLEGIEEQ